MCQTLNILEFSKCDKCNSSHIHCENLKSFKLLYSYAVKNGQIRAYFLIYADLLYLAMDMVLILLECNM